MGIKIKIKKLNNEAVIPVYKTKGAAGVDLYSIMEEELKPGDTKIIKTGLSIEIPEGYEAQVRPRSGLAVKGITVMNSPGTIDCDYRGEIMVILTNLGKEDFKVNKNERIAQMVFAKFEQAEWVESEDLSDTERGTNGFGSTGVK